MIITHHSDKQCFILRENDAEAILEYQLLPDEAIDFIRTYVPEDFRGQGFAEKLVREGLAWANSEGYTITASCWYVNKFLR